MAKHSIFLLWLLTALFDSTSLEYNWIVICFYFIFAREFKIRVVALYFVCYMWARADFYLELDSQRWIRWPLWHPNSCDIHRFFFLIFLFSLAFRWNNGKQSIDSVRWEYYISSRKNEAKSRKIKNKTKWATGLLAIEKGELSRQRKRAGSKG